MRLFYVRTLALLLLVVSVSACASTEREAPISASASDVRYEQHEFGESLMMSLRIENVSDKPIEGGLFVWTTHSSGEARTRSVFPATAIRLLTERRQVLDGTAERNADLGHALSLEPGESEVIEVGMIQPDRPNEATVILVTEVELFKIPLML